MRKRDYRRVLERLDHFLLLIRKEFCRRRDIISFLDIYVSKKTRGCGVHRPPLGGTDEGENVGRPRTLGPREVSPLKKSKLIQPFVSLHMYCPGH